MTHAFAKRSRGVALIMVLMITGVLGLLMLQIGLTAREHVARTQKLLDRAEASLQLQSRETAMLFTMLTQEWVEGRMEKSSVNSYAAVWNFRGEPFDTDGARFRVQDIKGLFPMPQPGDSTRGLDRFLVALGVPADRAARVAEQFSLFEVSDRERQDSATIPLQSFGELRGVVDLTSAELLTLESRATLFPNSEINPLTASAEFLITRFDASAVEMLTQGRSTSAIDAVDFSKIVGKGADDLTVFYPGPALRFDIDLGVRDVRFRRESTLVVRPYADEPVILWGRRRLDSEGSTP